MSDFPKIDLPSSKKFFGNVQNCFSTVICTRKSLSNA